LIGEGAAVFAYGQTLKDTSYSGGGYYYYEDWSQPRTVYRAVGIGSMATGAVLMAVGLSKKR